MATEVALISVV